MNIGMRDGNWLAAAACLLMAGSALSQQPCVEGPECDSGQVLYEACIGAENLLDVNGDRIRSVLQFPARRLCDPNPAANVLMRLDIDSDGVVDITLDSDNDGLPDNWELGGVETVDRNGDGVVDDRVVYYPAPTAIVPGTPPTQIFARRAVATSAFDADTDGDGLTDFVEVFGLMFIDENRNGLLDTSEWKDLNGDGLPSVGEFPLDNSGFAGVNLQTMSHDFDGFVFTDPTNPDTDGDGLCDGQCDGGDIDTMDLDPLINPRAFGEKATIFVRFNLEGNADIDKDGLGNGMDMGNDLVPGEAVGVAFQTIDNPENLRDIVDLFRRDLAEEDVMPESVIEDLLGADWNGDGLWRTTDVRNWSLVIDDATIGSSAAPPEFYLSEGGALFSPQTLSGVKDIFNGEPGYSRFGGRGLGLAWQEELRPNARSIFMPDMKIWAILYAWRVPGFDIDGDGFVGVPNLTATAKPSAGDQTVVTALVRDGCTSGAFLVSEGVPADCNDETAACLCARPMDDRIPLASPDLEFNPELDGIVEVPRELSDLVGGIGGCTSAILPMGLLVFGLTLTRLSRGFRKI